MRRFSVALAGVLAISMAGCAEVYHGYFGYGDMEAAQPAIPFDAGELTTTLDVRRNEYSGNVIAVKVLFGVRNTSAQDRCVVVTFLPDAVSRYGVPARLPVFVRRGRADALPIELWAHEAAEEYTWPSPAAFSTVTTAQACA